MKPTRRFEVMVMLFTVAGLLTGGGYCLADCSCSGNCGFTGDAPPRYQIEFSGVVRCSEQQNPHPLNGTYYLEYEGGCLWRQARYDPNSDYWDIGLIIDESQTYIYVRYGEKDQGDPNSEVCEFEYEGGRAESGSGSNEHDEGWCDDPNKNNCGCDAGLGGTAEWSPVWDSNGCDISISMNPGTSPVYYGHEDCCPPPAAGAGTAVIMTSSNADCVSGEYTVEEFDPPSGTWKSGSKLVEVEMEKTANCEDILRVTFTITPQKGKPPAKARVTCTGKFETVTGCEEPKDREIMVEPQCGQCCEDKSLNCRKKLI